MTPDPPPADALARWDALPAKWWYYSRDAAVWVDCDADFAAEACAMGWRVKLASQADHSANCYAVLEPKWDPAPSLPFGPNMFDARWESKLTGLGERLTPPTPTAATVTGPAQGELFWPPAGIAAGTIP